MSNRVETAQILVNRDLTAVDPAAVLKITDTSLNLQHKT